MVYSRDYKIKIEISSENEKVNVHSFWVREGTDELTVGRLTPIGNRVIAQLAAADARAVDPDEEDL